MKRIARRLSAAFLSLTLLLSLTPTAFASEALGDDLRTKSTPLAQGTTLQQNAFWSNFYSDLRQENVIIYEPNEAVKPIVTYGSSVTSTVTLGRAARALEAEGYRVVGGINGDYFGMVNGVPMGTTMTEGVLRNVSPLHYAVGFRADGSAMLGKPDLVTAVTTSGGHSFTVSAVNQVRYSYSGIYLYSHEFNARRSTGTNEAGYDVVCSVTDGRLSIGETLTLRVDAVYENAVDTVLEAGQYVLTANLLAGEEALSALGKIAVGDELKITVTAADEMWNEAEHMVGALYQLVENGAVCSGLEAGAGPRSAIGLTAEGSVVLYNIDGRQAEHSIGASLTQMAQRMIELGCVTALSLDGGGSATFYATLPDQTAAAAVNRPSEGRERAVTNHIFLISPPAEGAQFDHVSLRLSHDYALAGAEVGVYAAAIDTAYRPMADAEILLGAEYGRLQNGILYTPLNRRTLRVGAKVGEAYALEILNVVESPEEIRLYRDGKGVSALTLSPGDSVALTAKAFVNRLPIAAQNDDFFWSVEGGIGTVDAAGVFTAAERVGSGSLTVRAGETALTIPVILSADPLILLNDFEAPAEPFTKNEAMGFVRFGRASARLDYSLDGLAPQVYPFDHALPAGYDRVTLWVYGDGSEAMLCLETDAGSVDAALLAFTGWQQLSVALPEGATRLTALSLSAAAELSGTLYLDQLVAAYGNLLDNAAPELSLTLDSAGAVYGVAFDAVDGGNLTALSLRYDGAALPFTHDKESGRIYAVLPDADLEQHRVSLVAADASGHIARTGVDIPLSEDAEPAFLDTAAHWARGAISYLKRAGISQGDGAYHYNPDTNISREEFATLLYRYLKPTEDLSGYELPFADAEDISSWAYEAVGAMAALGVTTGSDNIYGELCFNPKSSISRAEAVTMLGRLLEKGYDATFNFTDNEVIPSWAAEYVGVLSSIGVLTGDGDGAFRPAAPMTRAEVATVLYRLL